MITYSKKAQAVLECAARLAADSGGIVYSEHLLYGLLAVGGTTACNILNMSGIYARDFVKGRKRYDVPALQSGDGILAQYCGGTGQ